MGNTFSQLPVSEFIAALARTREAAFLWTPEDDKLVWAEHAAALLRAPELTACETGYALRQLYRAGDVEQRDNWIAEPVRRSAFIGTHRIGPVEDGLWVEERLTRLSKTHFLGLMRNVSAERAEYEKLTYLAHFDELTGHLSRPHLRAVLARRLADATERGGDICFAVLGLDNMMGVNSAFGYDIADVVLVAIGREIARRLGPGDVLGRLGSSKFAVVFSDCPQSDLLPRLAMIQSAIRDTVIETSAGPIAVTVSAAGVVLPEHAATTHDAFAAAEDSLTAAKQSGVDQLVLFEPDEKARARRRDNIAVADDLVAAVRENRLRLAYQPIVSAEDPMRVAFYECLLRLIDRSGKLVTAGAFMPVAEKLGLVRMLDKRVIELAFETLRAHPRVRLSVNISPQSLRDSAWLQLFDRLAEQNPALLERLILEVTEATAIEDTESIAATLNVLRSRGCAIALDDFGAGYTSFQQFKDLQLDMVKIDGSYVRGVLDNLDNQLFVRTLGELAKNYELMVVAEMVENDEAGDLLRTLGVDALQGFHFGMPEIEPPWLAREDGSEEVKTAV